MDGPTDHDLLIRLDERVAGIVLTVARVETKTDKHLENHKSEKRAIRGAIFGAIGAGIAAVASWLMG